MQALLDLAAKHLSATPRDRSAKLSCLTTTLVPWLQGGLSPPPPLGGTLLLPRPWALLLRMLLQCGVPPATLRALASHPQGLSEAEKGAEAASFTATDAELEERIWAKLPVDAKASWLSNPHRMVSLGAQVGQYVSGLPGLCFAPLRGFERVQDRVGGVNIVSSQASWLSRAD